MSKYGHRQHNWFEAIVNKIGGEERADAFLRNELTVEPALSWRERDGIIRFAVTSDGTTGEEWIKRLEVGGYNVELESLLSSPDFKPTSGVTTEIVIMKGFLFGGFEGEKFLTSDIRARANKRKYIAPNPEVACLIREKFTDHEITEKMYLYRIVVMHEPIKDCFGDKGLLSVHFADEDGWIGSSNEDYPDGWLYDYGFAFELPSRVK